MAPTFFFFGPDGLWLQPGRYLGADLVVLPAPHGDGAAANVLLVSSMNLTARYAAELEIRTAEQQSNTKTGQLQQHHEHHMLCYMGSGYFDMSWLVPA